MDKTEPLHSSHRWSVTAGRVGQLFARKKANLIPSPGPRWTVPALGASCTTCTAQSNCCSWNNLCHDLWGTHSAQKGDLLWSAAPWHCHAACGTPHGRCWVCHSCLGSEVPTVCQKQMKSWQSLGRVEVYMNHIFICEKFEEEHDVRLQHVWKGM